MQVTDQMLLAYQVDLIWDQIKNDPRYSMCDPKTKEPSYIFAIRRANTREIGSFICLKQSFANAKSDEEKLRVLQYSHNTIGSDGAIYKNAQHTNSGLIPGQNYIFSFVASSKTTIAKALIAIKDFHNRTATSESSSDLYGTMVFALNAKTAKQNMFQGTYGNVWGDYLFNEIHLPTIEYDPNALLSEHFVADLGAFADNCYYTRDLVEILNKQDFSIAKNDPYNFENFQNYIFKNKNYPSTHGMICDLYEDYFIDSVEENSIEENSDNENFNYKESKNNLESLAELESQEEFEKNEIKETVYGIVNNPDYSSQNKKDILNFYFKEMFNCNKLVVDYSKEFGFNFIPSNMPNETQDKKTNSEAQNTSPPPQTPPEA